MKTIPRLNLSIYDHIHFGNEDTRRVIRKPFFDVSDHRAVQPQKAARGLPFRILEGDGLYYLRSENKASFLPTRLVFYIFSENVW